MYDYDIDISDEECRLALLQVTDLFDDLGNPTLSTMTLPTIALSSTKLEYDDYGSDFEGKVELVLDVERLSKGAVKSVTPQELRSLLFHEDVREQVTEALVSAMAWIADLEARGSNATNENAIAAHLRSISAAVSEGLEKFQTQRTLD